MTEPVTYAIGDVHGEAARLKALHAAIFAQHEKRHAGAPLRLVHLGDYVDRGPDSYEVIKTLQALEDRDDLDVINLRGNHEQMMIDAYEEDSDSRLHWLMNGGDATIASYAKHGYEDPPQDDLAWLKALPTLHLDKAEKTAFVHAGVDPRTFPNCDERIHLWTRSPRFFNPNQWDIGELEGWRVVHGHTPTDDFEPQLAGTPVRRFNLDTGAVYGGKLTAAIFAHDEPVEFISI
ncbi:metallophosphoesterase family protein [Henriciella aquimarina]|uniref:metallophosphoesterase family protein n=1 Tax=Henriciella aquimarina TaxID=545261 RepID=UPI000A0214C4|nr:metallophosphoesterase family protein [Henriciella aquimarina]